MAAASRERRKDGVARPVVTEFLREYDGISFIIFRAIVTDGLSSSLFATQAFSERPAGNLVT
ncbi:hypothetical protein [Marinimicrobium sp. ARAG 43.8]|uniref:hypothetical protein n=1 Tax=Marinimicrobium sp. ARAG 43.8 TaxID=3418719 RepID=UPI003CF53C52